MWKNILLAAVVFFCLFRNSFGQETVGHLQGCILDEQGRAIPAVNIVVTSPQVQGERGATTNDDGCFWVAALPAGFYTVRISHVAYKTIIFQRLPVRLGKTTSLGEIRMQSQIVELAEVVVNAEKPVIDPVSTTIGENLRYEFIDELPVERDFQSVTALIPQANASYYEDAAGGGTEGINIAGSTGPENAYFIDGVNATDPWFADRGTILPYNFVREIEIKTGGYQAEYGRSLGGIINVLTPSGGNEFHGQVFGFFSNNELGGERKSALNEAEVIGFSLYDVGFSLSGPIVRDRLWFNAAYSPNFEREDISIPALGTMRNSNTAHLFVGKLTWRAPGSTDLIFSLFGDPSVRVEHDVPYPPFAGFTVANKEVLRRRYERGGINVSLQARRAIGRKFLLEGHLSYLSTRESAIPDTERGIREPFLVDLETVTLSGGAAWMRDNKPRRFAARLSGELFLGKHRLKMGLEYEDNMVDISNQTTGPTGFVLHVNDSLYRVVGTSAIGKVHNRVPSLFLQDSWQITRRLTLNAGLRWDGQYFVGSDGKVAQSITGQFQPRLGFILQPGEPGSAKIFASYGRFYEQLTLLFPGFNYIENNIEIIRGFDHNPLLDPSDPFEIIDNSRSIHPEVEDLQGQYFDEFILGYERRILNGFKMGITGIYRKLGQVVENGRDPETDEFRIGNPGQGDLDFFPKLERDYKALEFSLQRSLAGRFNFIASYVISRSHGNYTGLFNAEWGAGFANVSPVPDYVDQIPNSEGLLPNDRTHLFKFSGSYRSGIGLNVGASFIWQSGTPITELGRSASLHPIFLSPRGTAGRTPAFTGLNFRFKYDLGKFVAGGFRSMLVGDIFNVLNQRKAATVNQTHYFGSDANGNPILPNPDYLRPLRFYPERQVRLGMQIEF